MAEIALVTGASRGIGAEIAKTLARDGFDIWLNYRSNSQKANEVKQEIEKLDRKCTLLEFDVTDFEKTKQALEPMLLNNEIPFAIINNAGFRRDNLLAWLTQEEWKSVINVNLDGFFNVVKQILPYMLNKKRGRIVSIASVSGHIGVAGQTGYSAAKAGIIGASKSLAAEVAKKNVLVNVVSPGFVETDMLEGLPIDAIIKTIPLRRLGKPQDIAELVSFLCSQKANYITGQAIQVNGGIC
ncbi:MAG: 3-oxoacyl-ACP reductase FabG [Elusimicrobia bacterium]|nr:3-oxoacyl-ACP reductase FabG [Elusimicrobiota bacterium]